MVKKFKLKKGDTVVVRSGKYKSVRGEVLKVLRDSDKLLVSGVNIHKKHQKPSASSEGGIVEIEAPIHISNVAFWDEKKGTHTKIGFKYDGDVKKRFCKKTGEFID
jgi:large subunit ribosomal protein L24